MTREEALEEIEAIVSKAKLQAAGFADHQPEPEPRELAEYILQIAEQVSS